MKASKYLCQFFFGVVLGTLAAVFTHSWWMTGIAAVGGTFLGGYLWDAMSKDLVTRSRREELMYAPPKPSGEERDG